MSVLRRLFGRVFGAGPFARLAATHAVSTSADAFFTISLAGSLFFNVSIGAARPRIIGYLVVSLAPFIVLAPLVGPLIDRFGSARRIAAASSCLGRGILCLFAATDLRNVLLYPEAFGILVLQKAYSVTKSALVPSLVDEDADLVAANSRLTRIATVAGLLGGAIAAGIVSLGGAGPVLRVGSLVYFAAAAVALSMSSDDRAPLTGAAVESRGLRSSNIRFAAGVMVVLRAAIGFLVFLVAFGLKRAGEPTWFFGVVAAFSVAGGLVGTIVSPILRRRLRRDEPLLAMALLAAALLSLLTAAGLARATVAVAVFAIACAASMGRQGFDSILQRDAPTAARGRSFARFETLFQLCWVIGALAGVITHPTTRTGLAALGIMCAVALVVYVIGTSVPRASAIRPVEDSA
jgi:MFS family permease